MFLYFWTDGVCARFDNRISESGSVISKCHAHRESVSVVIFFFILMSWFLIDQVLLHMWTEMYNIDSFSHVDDEQISSDFPGTEIDRVQILDMIP